VSALLEVHELSVSFGGLRALQGLSLEVPPGGLTGLIGPNGAGKTTAIDALCGFVPYTGTVSLAGQRIDDLRAHERARAGIVRTFQSVELFEDLTVRENLLVAAVPSRWWAPLVDAVAPRRRARGIDVDHALETVALQDLADANPSELSHGQRRLVSVARALAGGPKVLLLDEPAAGLNPTETAALGDMLRTLPSDDIGVLLVDHDMTLVLDVCDTLTVLDLGAVIASGPAAAVRDDPAVITAYLGEVT
jgi:ABC-type branched-subunit amino acid transport system ATPase component